MAVQDLPQLQKHIYAQYTRQHAELGDQGTLDHLERGKQFDLSDKLKNGGVLVFPAQTSKTAAIRLLPASMPAWIATPIRCWSSVFFMHLRTIWNRRDDR